MKQKIKKILKFFDLTESTVIGAKRFWLQDEIEQDNNYDNWKMEIPTNSDVYDLYMYLIQLKGAVDGVRIGWHRIDYFEYKKFAHILLRKYNEKICLNEMILGLDISSLFKYSFSKTEKVIDQWKNQKDKNSKACNEAYKDVSKAFWDPKNKDHIKDFSSYMLSPHYYIHQSLFRGGVLDHGLMYYGKNAFRQKLEFSFFLASKYLLRKHPNSQVLKI